MARGLQSGNCCVCVGGIVCACSTFSHQIDRRCDFLFGAPRLGPRSPHVIRDKASQRGRREGPQKETPSTRSCRLVSRMRITALIALLLLSTEARPLASVAHRGQHRSAGARSQRRGPGRARASLAPFCSWCCGPPARPGCFAQQSPRALRRPAAGLRRHCAGRWRRSLASAERAAHASGPCPWCECSAPALRSGRRCWPVLLLAEPA